MADDFGLDPISLFFASLIGSMAGSYRDPLAICIFAICIFVGGARKPLWVPLVIGPIFAVLNMIGAHGWRVERFGESRALELTIDRAPMAFAVSITIAYFGYGIGRAPAAFYDKYKSKT